MEKKNKKFEWKYVGYFFSGLAGLFVVTFLINLLIVTEVPFKVAQDNDGGYLSKRKINYKPLILLIDKPKIIEDYDIFGEASLV